MRFRNKTEGRKELKMDISTKYETGWSGTFQRLEQKDTGAVCPIDETQKILDRVKPAKHWHELREVDGCRSEHVELLVAGNGLRLNNRPRVVVQDGAGAQK